MQKGIQRGKGMENKKTDTSGRNMGIYISTLLCTSALVVLTVMANVGNWPTHFYVITWIQMAIIIYTVIDKRIPITVQGIIYGLFNCSTAWLAGAHFRHYHVVFTMFCGIIMLVAFYKSKSLVIFETVIACLAIALHHFVFDTLPLYNPSDYMEFGLEMFLMIGISISICTNIERDNIARVKLQNAVLDAESSEHAKSDFLANMSHEIRTPMNAIIGMCELALRESSLSETVREYCAQIQNSGRSLLSIINDILDFSKIESGKMELIEDEFNLASTLNDVVNMTMARLGDKNLEVIVKVNPSIPRTLIGDEIRIRQIMINLLTNAVKYTEKGVIELNVTRTFREYGINLVVSVKDSGIGISEKNLEKLFSSFQQVDTKKNRSVEGTGLGLVISKRLITKMGGFIMVKSEYGQGSEFRFVIPLKVKEERPFIQINDAERISAACFINTQKFEDERTRKAYKKFLERIGESIQVKYYMFSKFEELKKRIDAGSITHCFVGKEEYVAHSEYFNQSVDKTSIIIVQNRRNAVVVPNNMRCLYKPIYELPLASVFNNENSIINLMEEKIHTNTFIAPKARVLIVDDNVVNLQVAVGLMQPYKMQVLTVTSGADAIRILGSKDFDIVFMDHMMPEMDGVEATKILRDKPEEYYKTLPIIALTANAVSGAREMYLSNGFNGFITKPIELSALERVLKHNLPEDKLEKPEIIEKEDEKRSIKVEEGSEKYIDTNVGLSYIGNNIDTYMSILSSYVEKGKEKVKQIAKLYEEEDWKNYVIEVHALKSSSLSIGAKELSEKAKKLELSGKAGDTTYIKNNHDEMIKLYAEVLSKGDSILEQNTAKEDSTELETVAIELDELKAALIEIKEAIGSFDTDEVIAVAQKYATASYKDIAVGTELNKALKAAEDFDYDKAEEIVAGLIDQCEVEVN